MEFRTEKDALGEKQVPCEAYYGIHSLRGFENFQISGKTLPIEMFHAIAEIKIACAKANTELGLLDEKICSVIVKAGEDVLKGDFDKEFVIDAYQAGAGTPTHMNVNEVMANIGIEKLGGIKGEYKIVHPNDHVNMGQSTNNVIPGALLVVSAKKIEKLLPVLDKFYNVLMQKGDEFKDVLKSGRTHMQDAVPITIGQEFEAYGASIRRSIDDLKFVGENILELNVGKNAIGTGINTHPEFTLKTCEYLKEINGFEWRVNPDAIYGTQYHTIFLKVSNALRMLAVNVNKIVSDLIILSSGPRTGINELILPPVEPGSSIMPGKVNPNVAEMMKMICFQVFGNDTVINFAANAGQLELNYMAPLESKNLIESLDILTNGIKTFDEICVSGIKVNEKVNRFNFENSAGLATLLNPYIGYDNAAEIVNESLESGKSIPELVIEKGLMDKEKLDKILSENVTKPNM